MATSRHLGYYAHIRHPKLESIIPLVVRGAKPIQHFNGKFHVLAYELTKADCIAVLIELGVKRQSLVAQLLQGKPVSEIHF